jgi:Holliday junction DNA helicase RuvA
MISQVAGRIASKELDRVELMTAGGVAYELLVPLNVYEALAKVGDQASLFTHLVVKEDGWQLYGFTSAFERRVFQRVLGAKGVGPSLALGMLSTLTAERVVRAIREKDVVTLQSVPRVGRKKAEQLILDLADKLDDVQSDSSGSGGGARPEGASAEHAIRALVSLGYTTADAERAVRSALDTGGRGLAVPDLIRQSLARMAGR